MFDANARAAVKVPMLAWGVLLIATGLLLLQLAQHQVGELAEELELERRRRLAAEHDERKSRRAMDGALDTINKLRAQQPEPQHEPGPDPDDGLDDGDE